MFNRQLQIDVVKRKTDSETVSDQPELEFEEKVAVVTRAVERGVKKVGLIVFGYVILDTVRQVVIKSTK